MDSFLNYKFDDWTKIGGMVSGLGVVFMLLGVLLFFDRGFLAMGNILFLGGIVMVMGWRSMLSFFLRRNKLRGTVTFLGGVLLVLMGWTLVGILIEGFGFINLFGNFFPAVVATLSVLPGVGPILRLPVVSQLVQRLTEKPAADIV